MSMKNVWWWKTPEYQQECKKIEKTSMSLMTIIPPKTKRRCNKKKTKKNEYKIKRNKHIVMKKEWDTI